MTVPANIMAKLARTIALLSSNQLGERRAAFAAAEQILAAAGLGWRDVADLMSGVANTTQSPVAAEPEPAPDFHLYERPDGKFEVPEPELSPLLDTIRERVYFTPWEDQFLAGFEERCAKWPGSLVRLSEKQLAIFTRLIGRIAP